MRWLRCPFGISSAPELFQMKMYEIIHDLKGIEILADDILIYGIGDTRTEAIMDHNIKLEKLLIRLRENNCKLNKKKLNLCCSEVKFFGHVLSNEGLKADETKISAIKDMPSPRDKSDLLRFLGMLNYLGRYIKNLSAESSVLRKLTIEKAEWKWTQEEEREFQKLKMLVADTKSLKYFEVGKQLTVECDSSSTGLGVVVLQDEQVIAYASRTLTTAEKNYAMIEKELLAIVFACVRFDQLIVGNVTTLIKTDHKPLISIFNKPLLKAPKRLQLMLMVLQRYNIQLKFIEGKKNVIADTLSRASLEVSEDFNFINQSNVFKVNVVEDKIFKRFRKINLVESLKISDERINNIKIETMKDQSLQKLIPFIYNGWPNRIHEVPDDIRLYYKYKHELSTQDGLIFRNCKILIPYSLRKIMVDKVHVAHNGIETTIKLAKDNIFWPNMSKEIKEKIQMCDICVKYASSQPNLPMQSHEVPTYPFQYISMDVLATKLKGKACNMLVTVDHYSDFFELDVLRDLTPGAVIEHCKRNFSRHGIPQRVCTDNGTNFVNRQFKDFERTWEFEHVSSSPHHPRGNGKAEAAVKIAKNLIKKAEESHQDIWYCLLGWRNSPNKINTSPVQRLFSRKTRSGVPSCNEQYIPIIIDNVPEKIKEQHRKSKFYFDRKTKIIPELEIGQSVAVQVHPQMDKEWSLGVIEQQLKDRSYLVSVDGSTYRRNIVNIKPFVKEESTDKNDQNIKIPTLDTRSSSNSFDVSEVPEIIAQQGIPSSTLQSTGRPKRNIKLPSHLSDYHLY